MLHEGSSEILVFRASRTAACAPAPGPTTRKLLASLYCSILDQHQAAVLRLLASLVHLISSLIPPSVPANHSCIGQASGRLQSMDTTRSASAPDDEPTATPTIAVATDPRTAAGQVGEILKARNAERDNVFSGVLALVGYIVGAGAIVAIVGTIERYSTPSSVLAFTCLLPRTVSSRAALFS